MALFPVTLSYHNYHKPPHFPHFVSPVISTWWVETETSKLIDMLIVASASPSHLKHVATVPCEMLISENQRHTKTCIVINNTAILTAWWESNRSTFGKVMGKKVNCFKRIVCTGHYCAQRCMNSLPRIWNMVDKNYCNSITHIYIRVYDSKPHWPCVWNRQVLNGCIIDHLWLADWCHQCLTESRSSAFCRDVFSFCLLAIGA